MRTRGSDSLGQFLDREESREKWEPYYRGKMMFEAWAKEREARGLATSVQQQWLDLSVEEQQCWVAMGKTFGVMTKGGK